MTIADEWDIKDEHPHHQNILQLFGSERDDTFRLQVYLLHGVGPQTVGTGCGPGFCTASPILPKERLDIKSHETKNGTVCRTDRIPGEEGLKRIKE